MPVVDSPLPDEPEPLLFVLIRGVSRWSVFCDDNGDQAVATTDVEIDKWVVKAKKHIKRHSDGAKLAASGLCVAKLVTEEL